MARPELANTGPGGPVWPAGQACESALPVRLPGGREVLLLHEFHLPDILVAANGFLPITGAGAQRRAASARAGGRMD